MRISIGITIFNCEKYLADCLESCLRQDIPSSEYEIICVDDHSTDQSQQILKDYASKHENLSLIFQQKNLGVVSARNSALEAMHGDYCFFVDGDDFIAENCLGKIKEKLSGGCDILSLGRTSFHNEEGKGRSYFLQKATYLGPDVYGYVTSRIIKRSFLGDIRFQSNVFYGEDETLLFELNHKKPSIEKLDEPIYYYRLHSESLMSLNEAKRLKRIASVENAASYILKKYSYQGDAARFIDRRIDIALEDISTLDLSKGLAQLHQLKAFIRDHDIKIDKAFFTPRFKETKKSIFRNQVRKNKTLVGILHHLKKENN